MHATHDKPVAVDSNDMTDGGLLRVLVIGDGADFDDLSLALRGMRTYRTEAVRAKTADAARFQVAAGRFDVVLVDYRIGLGNGASLMQEIAGREVGHAVILITSLASAQVQQLALLAGSVHCLSRDDLEPRILEMAIRYALYTHALEHRLYGQLLGHRQAQQALERKMRQLSGDLDAKGESLLRTANIIEQSLHAGTQLSSAVRQISYIRHTADELKDTSNFITGCHDAYHDAYRDACLDACREPPASRAAVIEDDDQVIRIDDHRR